MKQQGAKLLQQAYAKKHEVMQNMVNRQQQKQKQQADIDDNESEANK